MSEKISIGIPTYNRPESLKRTLEYLLNQLYTNIEVIVSDNCSTNEKVKEVIDFYASKDKRIIPVMQKQNIGMVKNFSFVLEMATGNYFMWKSDDDVIEDSDFINKLYVRLTQTDSDFAFPDCSYANKNQAAGFTLSSVYSNCTTKIDYLRGITKTYSSLEFYGLYNLNRIKKDRLSFNENVVCPDLLFLPKLFLAFKVVFVPEAKYVFTHEPSADGFNINLNLFRDREIVLRDLIAAFAETEILKPSERKEIVVNILTYYEAILLQHYSISGFTAFKINVKNKIKGLLGLNNG